jgi:hypothetical protein
MPVHQLLHACASHGLRVLSRSRRKVKATVPSAPVQRVIEVSGEDRIRIPHVPANRLRTSNEVGACRIHCSGATLSAAFTVFEVRLRSVTHAAIDLGRQRTSKTSQIEIRW